MATKIRKPSPTQAQALTWLVEVKNGHAAWSTWDGALECFQERTWYACDKAGWVSLVREPEISRFPTRVVITDAGRAALAPTITRIKLSASNYETGQGHRISRIGRQWFITFPGAISPDVARPTLREVWEYIEREEAIRD